MVSDLELVSRLREFLSTSDLNTTTTSIVRRRLEEDFGIDLSDRKAFIREQVDLFLQNEFENAEEENKDELEIDELAEEIVKEEEDKEEEQEEEEEVEEEEEDVEEEKSIRASTRKSTAIKRCKKNEVKKRVGNGGGFTKPCSLSPELQKFIGAPELARTAVVKQLWSYIKEKNLQDPSNRQNIICDDALRDIFNVDSINMFKMSKALTKHIWPLDSDAAPVSSAPKEKKPKTEKDEASAKSAPKEKKRKKERDEDQDEPKKKEKSQRAGKSSFSAPLKLSDALVKFLGTGETELSRSDVVKRIWDYIKQNNLQDPLDRRQILCDEKLKELFEVDTYTGFGVMKLLSAHFVKTEQ